MGIDIYFSGKLKDSITALIHNEHLYRGLEELRLRVGKPVMIKTDEGLFFLGCKGDKVEQQDAYVCLKEDIDRSLELMSDYSLYAFNEEIKNGFITLPGGHRVGVCGQAVYDGKEIRTLKNICFMNFRIARERVGIANELSELLLDDHGAFISTLILSPAGFGKTTLLRDIIRCISNQGITVSVIDERSEIAACYKGVPQNDVGNCTDVLDLAPKKKGIFVVLRSMSPKVIAVDEINAVEDISAIRAAKSCGAALLCTMHRDHEIFTSGLMREKVFGRYIHMEKPREYRIYDGNHKLMKEGTLNVVDE